jgi:hypothetical protein
MADSKNATGNMSRWWALPAVVIGGLVGGAVSVFGPIARAEAAGISAGVFSLVLMVYWRRRLEKWFWPFMTSIGLAHVAAIIFFPWPSVHVFSKGDIAFVALDAIPYLAMTATTSYLNAGKPKGSY